MKPSLPAQTETIIRQPGEGKSLRVFGGNMRYFITGEESGGWLSGGIFEAPPDNGPPLHIHSNEDELFIVIEGKFAFFTNGAWTEGGPGTSAFLPRNKPHTFKNVGDTPGKLCVIANPPGMESFFDQCEEPFYREEGPDMETITGIAEKHGIRFV
jgi:quercetin dioxygenase-like cupin family protein